MTTKKKLATAIYDFLLLWNFDLDFLLRCSPSSLCIGSKGKYFSFKDPVLFFFSWLKEKEELTFVALSQIPLFSSCFLSVHQKCVWRANGNKWYSCSKILKHYKNKDWRCLNDSYKDFLHIKYLVTRFLFHAFSQFSQFFTLKKKTFRYFDFISNEANDRLQVLSCNFFEKRKYRHHPHDCQWRCEVIRISNFSYISKFSIHRRH